LEHDGQGLWPTIWIGRGIQGHFKHVTGRAATTLDVRGSSGWRRGNRIDLGPNIAWRETADGNITNREQTLWHGNHLFCLGVRILAKHNTDNHCHQGSEYNRAVK
jgi:hypothetical protein